MRPRQTHDFNRAPIMKAWTYLVTNKANKVLYTGVTSNLKSRIKSHKTKKYSNSFTARYNADKLVWYQEFDSIVSARAREKQIKAGNRARKIKLIEEKNPGWMDLYKTL